MNNTISQEEQSKYSKILSSMFCSTSIIALSILCLLNDLTMDFYNMIRLLEIVLPASFCFWFIGFVIGRILDSFNKKVVKQKILNEKQAYQIPSMFSMDVSEEMQNDLNLLADSPKEENKDIENIE